MAVAPAIAAGVGTAEVVVLALDAALRSCWFALLRPIPPATAPLPLPPAAPIRPRPRILTRHQARRGLPPLLARAWPTAAVEAIAVLGARANRWPITAAAVLRGAGLVTFPVVAAVGALALACTPLPGRCWTALQLGTVAGLGSVAWLVVQSVAVIGALRPWCMLVWAVTITAFWHVTAHNLAHGRLAAGAPGLILRHGCCAPTRARGDGEVLRGGSLKGHDWGRSSVRHPRSRQAC